MPYSNVPKEKWDKMDSCVKKVMAKDGVSKKTAIARCHSSIVGKDKKELSLADRANLIRTALRIGMGDEAYWQLSRVEVYDGFVVAFLGGMYWMMTYKLGSDYSVTFGEEWIPVEHSFIPIQRTIGTIPIKAIDDFNYECRGVLFGDGEHTDLEGYYFTPETDFKLHWFKTRPWLYHHGLHPQLGAEEVGVWKATAIDDEGVLFLEGELNRRQKYLEQVQILLHEGLSFPSTGALSYLVRHDEDRRFTQWPIVECTSTVGPAEFGMDPISPAARLALRSLLGEQGGVFHMGAEYKQQELPPEEEQETTPPEGTEEVTTPVAPDLEETTPADETDVPAADTPEITPEGEETEEVPEAVEAAVAKAVKPLVDQIKQGFGMIDKALKGLDERLQPIEDTMPKVIQDQVTQVKRTLENPDILGSLTHIATKMNTPIKDTEKKELMKDAPSQDPAAPDVMGSIHHTPQ
jgi:hypothetical protein